MHAGGSGGIINSLCACAPGVAAHLDQGNLLSGALVLLMDPVHDSAVATFARAAVIEELGREHQQEVDAGKYAGAMLAGRDILDVKVSVTRSAAFALRAPWSTVCGTRTSELAANDVRCSSCGGGGAWVSAAAAMETCCVMSCMRESRCSVNLDAHDVWEDGVLGRRGRRGAGLAAVLG